MNRLYKVLFLPKQEGKNALTFLLEASDPLEAELEGYKQFQRIQGDRTEFNKPIVEEMKKISRHL